MILALHDLNVTEINFLGSMLYSDQKQKQLSVRGHESGQIRCSTLIGYKERHIINPVTTELSSAVPVFLGMFRNFRDVSNFIKNDF